MEDIRKLIPQDKHDHERARAAIHAGYPAVEAILPELLVWLQDINWPVAQTLAPFLASIGEPLIPHLRAIFETDDEIWKGWVISCVVEDSPPLALAFREYLERVADNPTQNEIDEYVAVLARDVLEKNGWR